MTIAQSVSFYQVRAYDANKSLAQFCQERGITPGHVLEKGDSKDDTLQEGQMLVLSSPLQRRPYCV